MDVILTLLDETDEAYLYLSTGQLPHLGSTILAEVRRLK